MPRLVVCDFDGVVIPGIECSYALFKQQLPHLTIEEYRRWFDTNVHDYLLKNSIVVDLPIFHTAYEAAVAALPMEPPVRKLLAALAEHFTLAIVSSNSGAVIEHYLERSGVRGAFSHVWGSERHSCKVEKIRLLLEAHALGPRDCWFVTDTLGDLREGARAGVSCVGVTWGFHPRERLAQGGPCAIVDAPHELRDFLLTQTAGG